MRALLQEAPQLEFKVKTPTRTHDYLPQMAIHRKTAWGMEQEAVLFFFTKDYCWLMKMEGTWEKSHLSGEKLHSFVKFKPHHPSFHR